MGIFILRIQAFEFLSTFWLQHYLTNLTHPNKVSRDLVLVFWTNNPHVDNGSSCPWLGPAGMKMYTKMWRKGKINIHFHLLVLLWWENAKWGLRSCYNICKDSSAGQISLLLPDFWGSHKIPFQVPSLDLFDCR